MSDNMVEYQWRRFNGLHDGEKLTLLLSCLFVHGRRSILLDLHALDSYNPTVVCVNWCYMVSCPQVRALHYSGFVITVI